MITATCPNCNANAEFRERSQTWTESHGERCYEEWLECQICYAPCTDKELAEANKEEKWNTHE